MSTHSERDFQQDPEVFDVGKATLIHLGKGVRGFGKIVRTHQYRANFAKMPAKESLSTKVSDYIASSRT
jgi:hypothetical protein